MKKNVYQISTETIEHPLKKAQSDFQANLIRAAIELDRADLLDVVANSGFVSEEEAIPKSLWTVAQDIPDFYAFVHRKKYVNKIIRCDRSSSELSMVQHLFLWAILNNKSSLALHFWKRGTDQIANALIGHCLSKHMADLSPDGREKNSFEQQASEFESLAIGTLDECYRQDPEQACVLLTRYAKPFCVSPMDLAVQFGIMSFVAEPAASAYLDSVWKAEDPKSRGRLCNFWRAPRTKCAITSVFYILFLALFGHVLIFELGKELSCWDITLAVWVGSFIVEEIIAAFNPSRFLSVEQSDSNNLCTRLRTHFYDPWNYLDLMSLLVFVTVFILHAVPGPAAMHEVGRVLLCLDYLLFILRLLKTLTVSRSIGPMLPMIWNMLGDLIPFLVILFVFVFAYAVTSEALLHPDTEWHPLYLLFLPRAGFWPIFGEYGLDTADGSEDCTENKSWYVTSGGSTCPSRVGRHMVPVLLGLYILITNVLMLNLLIAYFNHSFEKVHAKSNIWWAWLRCGLLREYYNRYPIPPPITLFCRCLQLLCKSCCLCCLLVCSCCCLSKKEPSGRYKKKGLSFGFPTLRRRRRKHAEDADEYPGADNGFNSDMLVCRARMEPTQAFREEGNVLEIIDLDDFRFTSMGRRMSMVQLSGPPTSVAGDSGKVWEAARAAVHLATISKQKDVSSTQAGSASRDKQRAQEMADLLSRLEKKIEENRVQLKFMNSVLERVSFKQPAAEDLSENSSADEAQDQREERQISPAGHDTRSETQIPEDERRSETVAVVEPTGMVSHPGLDPEGLGYSTMETGVEKEPDEVPES